MCCVRHYRGPAWCHGASSRDLNRVRHGFDRGYDLLSLRHHWRYAAWKPSSASGTARLVSKCSFHHTWRAFVPAVGTAIGRPRAASYLLAPKVSSHASLAHRPRSQSYLRTSAESATQSSVAAINGLTRPGMNRAFSAAFCDGPFSWGVAPGSE